jgi:hypothetical protein
MLNLRGANSSDAVRQMGRISVAVPLALHQVSNERRADVGTFESMTQSSRYVGQRHDVTEISQQLLQRKVP